MISERSELGKIEILQTGHIQVRKDTIIERDGVEIARTFHRVAYMPGEPVDDFAEDPTHLLKRIAYVVRTTPAKDLA